MPAPVGLTAWDARLHKNELIHAENAWMALSSPKEKSVPCDCLQWSLQTVCPSVFCPAGDVSKEGKDGLDLHWKRWCPLGWVGWETQGWIEKPDKSEYNNWSIFRPKCLGKPFLKSGIICLLESAINVITFSIISYLLPIVQISYIAAICRVVSPIQRENNMQNIFWLRWC